MLATDTVTSVSDTFPLVLRAMFTAVPVTLSTFPVAVIARLPRAPLDTEIAFPLALTVPAEIVTSWTSAPVAVARMPSPPAITLPTEMLMSPFRLWAEMALLAPVPVPDTFPVA